MATVAGTPTTDARSPRFTLSDALTFAGLLALLAFAGAVAVVGKSFGDETAPAKAPVSVPTPAKAPVAPVVAAGPAADAGQDASHAVGAPARSAALPPALPGLPFLPTGFYEIPIGVPYADGAWEYTVVDVRRVAHLGTGVIVDVPSSGEFLIAGVRLRRLDDAGGPGGLRGIGIGGAPSPQEFQLRDAAGAAYAPATLLSSDRWARRTGYDGGVMPRGGSPLNVGDAATYALAFDIPAGADGLRLRLLRPKLEVALQLP